MNRQFWSLSLLLTLCLGIFSACEKEDPAGPGNPGNGGLEGLLVVNQGNFGQGNGTLSYLPAGASTTETDKFNEINGEAVGGIIESMYQHGENFYIVANVADKLVVTNANTLEKTDELVDAANLNTPRYMAFNENTAYVSVWGPYTDLEGGDYSLKQSKITVVDLQTLEITETVPVPSSPEGLLFENDQLFVVHTSDSLSIVNTTTNTVTQKVKTDAGASHIVMHDASSIWVAHSGGWNGTDGQFVQYSKSNLEELQSIEMPGIKPNGKHQLVGNELYFLASGSLYTINLTAASPAPVLVAQRTGLSTFWVDATTGEIYLGLSDSANPGTLLHLDDEGEEMHSMPLGVFPHKILKID